MILAFLFGFMIPICIGLSAIYGFVYPEKILPDEVWDKSVRNGALFGALLGFPFAMIFFLCVQIVNGVNPILAALESIMICAALWSIGVLVFLRQNTILFYLLIGVTILLIALTEIDLTVLNFVK